MKTIRSKIHSLAGKDSFLNEKTLRIDNIILLFSIALVVFIHPFINSMDSDDWIIDVLLSILIVSGITSLKFRREKFIRLSYFGLFTFTLIWINHFVNSLETKLLSFVVLVVFLIYITYSMIYYVARNRDVTPILILNAINSYLLMGIIGALLFILTDVAYERLFDISISAINFGYTNNPIFFDYIYYSFITLTTVGYGDATPVIPLTRSLAMLVSLSGQLYLTILIAMLVGKYLSKNN